MKTTRRPSTLAAQPQVGRAVARRLLAILILVLATAVSATAEETPACNETDQTLSACHTRIVQEALAERLGKEVGEAREEARMEKDAEATAVIAAKPNPTDTGSATPATKDFLPRIVTALGLGEIEEGEGFQTLTLNLSSPSSAVQAVLRGTRRDPVPLEALVQALPEPIRQDRKGAIEDGLGDFDDFETALSFNVEKKTGRWRLGRSFSRYERTTREVFGALAPPPDLASTQAFLALADKLDFGPKTPVAQASAGLTSAVAENAIALAEDHARFDAALREGGYFRLAELIANQPQVHFEVAYRDRQETVGPDEVRLKATYEHGFGNINGLLRYEDCAGGIDKACYVGYLDEVGDSIDEANRVSFSLEYAKASEVDYTLPADDFTFTLDEGEKLTGSLVYGRNLTRDDKGKETSRLDLEAKYEDVTGDPKRNSRFVTTATYSMGISGGNTLAFDLVYANKPEYLGEVDEELSARVGLRFKLDKPEK